MTVINMECRAGMATLPSNSVDCIVTDPPYGLSKEPDMAEVLRHWLAGDDYTHTGAGFMGKSWDSFVPGPSVWREALRVLKPGGHALVFAGSRTQDLMSVSLRLAGFEIRDTAMWLYGSGFPKSLNVSKVVEQAHGTGAGKERARRFTAWMRSTGITAAQINEATGSAMASHYLTDKSQPAIATLDQFLLMAHLLPEPPAGIMEVIHWRTVESENMKRRNVTGIRPAYGIGGEETFNGHADGAVAIKSDPHTDAAKQWEGYGTALKPAYEPIIIARKPLIGTVAENVLRHGTGAINIDACRVPADDGQNRARPPRTASTILGGGKGPNLTSSAHNDQGRWPANILHDGLDGEEWTRYFYCAKASKADRNAGCDNLEHRTAGDVTGGRTEGSDGLNSPRAGAGRTSGARNHHPTVKPTELMRWCCRLVGHPGAMVLDPFAGSGSTGRGAVLEGFNFIGFEMDPDYATIANARIAEARLQPREQDND